MDYTDEQRRVVEIAAGRHLVLAPPGTGKTQMLSARVTRALERGVDPRRMLCGTFTIRAAAEMRARIAADTRRAACELPLTGNLHHICHRFLFQNRLVPEGCQVADGNFKAETLAALRRELGEDAAEEEVMARYARVKRDLLVLDFDDLLTETYRVLSIGPRPPEFRPYEWIQIDEVQDLSPLQWKIIHELAAPDAVCVFFGDREQAIFSFLGADAGLLDAQGEACEVHYFETNFRATSYLLDLLARYSFRTLDSAFAFLPFPARHEPARGRLRVLPHADMARVLAEARDLLSGGRTDQVAVLVQTNSQADEAERCARELGLPCVKVSGFEFNARKVFRDLAALVETAVNPRGRLAWARLLRHFARRHVPDLRAAQALAAELARRRIDPRELLDGAFFRFNDDAASGLTAAFADHFAARAAPWFKIFDALLDGPFDLRALARAFIVHSAAHRLYTPADCRRMVFEQAVGEADTDADGAPPPPDGETYTPDDLLAPLERFFAYLDARYADDPRPMRAVLAADWAELAKLKEADLVPDDARLVISTIHKAKGRQFDTVIIPYCEDSWTDRETGQKVNGFPSFQVKFYGADRDENARLLYVGMSRAKTNLVLATTGDAVSPYLDPCLECFRPDFTDFYCRVRANGGRLYAFDETDWFARFYYLLCCKRARIDPPQFVKWFDDSCNCVRRLAYTLLRREDHAAVIDEVIARAFKTGDAIDRCGAVACVRRWKDKRFLRDLRLLYLRLRSDARGQEKADILAALAALLPERGAVEGLEDAVFDDCGALRLAAARRLAAHGIRVYGELLDGTEADAMRLRPHVTPRVRRVLEWRARNGVSGPEWISALLRP